jgi:Patatin-like phospholipase
MIRFSRSSARQSQQGPENTRFLLFRDKVPAPTLIEVPVDGTYVGVVACQSLIDKEQKSARTPLWIGDFSTAAMNMSTRRTIFAVIALLLAPAFAPSGASQRAAFAQGVGVTAPAPSTSHRHLLDQVQPTAPAHRAKTPTPPPPPPPTASADVQLPPRVPFTAEEDAVAVIPGIPDARFWADSVTDFKQALPPQAGPWLVLSSGGEDGAFGAGLLDGLGASGKRPDYTVITAVSTGALMAPFVFAGRSYDDSLRRTYTHVSAADIFEAGRTPESFVDSWPLKDLLAKEVTPALLEDIAAAHRSGRRLFVVTTDLDAERSVVWNMGAIAAHGGEDALKLFRSVLLASASVPGAFPPVLIDVEANGKRFAEMHVDGGVGGQFFVLPPPLMSPVSDYRLPATELYIVVNTGLGRDFAVVDRFVPTILSQTVDAAVKVDTRMMLNVAYVVAKRSGVGFNVATIPQTFNVASKGPFDPTYMTALFQVGYDQARSANPFSTVPPPYPGAPPPRSSQNEKSGVN